MKSEIKEFLNKPQSKEDLEKYIYYIIDKTQKIMINRLKVYGKPDDKILNELCKEIK